MARGRGSYVQRAETRYARAQARLRSRGRGSRGRGRGGRGLGPAAPMPFDSQAQREATELGREAADTRVGLGARYEEAQQRFGFGSGASNPYSEAAQLKREHEADRRGIRNAAGNQLYSGSTLNKQAIARRQFDMGQKELEGAFAKEQAAYTKGIASTQQDEQMGLAEIREGAIGRAAESEPDPLAVGAGKGRGRGRGRRNRINEARNISRPQRARVLNRKARTLNTRINRRNRRF